MCLQSSQLTEASVGAEVLVAAALVAMNLTAQMSGSSLAVIEPIPPQVEAAVEEDNTRFNTRGTITSLNSIRG